MNEFSRFLFADPLFLNHFVRQKSSGRSARWRSFIREPAFLNHFVRQWACGGDPTRPLAIIFAGTTFPQSLRSPAGLRGRSDPTAGIIFRGSTFPQSLRSPAGLRERSGQPAGDLFSRDPLFLNHFPARLRGRSDPTAGIIFRGPAFPQSLRSPAGLRGLSDWTAGDYFSGTHFSSITSLSSRRLSAAREQILKRWQHRKRTE
jgi:hypothetical protein